MSAQSQECAIQKSVLESMLALPAPLLELILIPGTSIKDKKAIRQACKLFRQTLDNNMTCIRLEARAGKKQAQCLERFLERVHVLNVILKAKYNELVFLKILPIQLTNLSIKCTNLNLKDLRNLPCLTSLCVNTSSGIVQGVEYITGLTRLDCEHPSGSVAHLAPTLKHLSIWDCYNVKGMSQLTNLEILRIHGSAPENFFETYRQLPLKAMKLKPSRCDFFSNAQAWEKAPPTLTHLALEDMMPLWPAVLPRTVTHLQMLAFSGYVDKAATALPGLLRLDLGYPWKSNRHNAIDPLTKLTSLRSLGMLAGLHNLHWHRQMILSSLPEVAKAVERGVQLNAMRSEDEFWGVFRNPLCMKSAWATHS